MMSHKDWRLQDQDRWLQGAELKWMRYKMPRPEWDHDHCEFCSTKFSEHDDPSHLHEGYTTPYQDKKNNYRWICKTCFNDFKDRFDWKVIS